MSNNNSLLAILNIEKILAEKNDALNVAWQAIIKKHPADLAYIIEKLSQDNKIKFIRKLPEDLSAEVFEKLQNATQVEILLELTADEATKVLKQMPVDTITDLLEVLPDDIAKKYLKLLQTKQRKQVLSLLSFAPKTAGGIMNTDVLTLNADLSIKKCITLLQKIGVKKEHYERIYITDQNNVLVGHIHLDELVTNKPETIIKNLLHKNDLVIETHEDQEDVAKKMRHYDLLSAPVVDKNNNFLGIITAEDIFDILEEETSEDVYKISGVGPIRRTYFKSSLWELIKQRSPWLISLLLFQSVSGFIMSNYSEMISNYTILSLFITMLIGTGGNAGNQAGAIVIRGLATGEINQQNGIKMLFRELQVSIIISSILALVAFARVWAIHSNILISLVISGSLFLITVIAVLMGALLPLLLDRLRLDPANSAQPFLATLVDIIGISIYCIVASKILGI